MCVNMILIRLFSGGSDYVPIDGVNFEEATVFSINVTSLADGLVERNEAFFVTGRVLGVVPVPVTFGSLLEVTIESPPREFEGRFCVLCVCVMYNNSFEYMYTVQYVHVHAHVHVITNIWYLLKLYTYFEFGSSFLSSLHFSSPLPLLPSLLSPFPSPPLPPLPPHPLPLPSSLLYPPPSFSPSLINLTADIRFEEIVYVTSELITGYLFVCVEVTNGVLDFNLTVNIEVLPTSTAVGKHFKYPCSMYTGVIYNLYT